MGIVFQNIDEDSQKIFKKVANNEYKSRGYTLLEKFQKIRNDRLIENINEEKRKLEVMVKIFGRKTPLELSYM